MKTKLINYLFCNSKKTSILLMRIFVFSFAAASFATSNSTNDAKNKTELNYEQQAKITGTVTDAAGVPLPGVTIQEKGATNATLTDFDGNYTITPSSADAVLVFSSIGFVTQEVTITNQTTINITLAEDVSQLDEVIVVGFGTQKKVNLTAAVSQVGEEVFKDRPTANAMRSLQGNVPGLVISNSASGGEPGASSNINIRGFLTSTSEDGVGSIEDAGPLVLVDGIEMDLNDINPDDIESVSVLKDAAAASIYGSRAAGGAVLVTTKSGKNNEGKIKVSYSANYAMTQPSIWPESASPINFAYAVNDARTNNAQAAYHDETDLANIIANMADPGSAPTIVANAAGTGWSYGTIGIEGTGATNWDDIIMKDWAQRVKQNFNISGGTEKLNFYLSAGTYEEDGLLAVGNESFQRYNLDAKFSAKVKDWLTLEMYSKYRRSYTDFPTEINANTVFWNKSRVLDLITKIKPTLPLSAPRDQLVDGVDVSDDDLKLLQHAYYPFWDYTRFKTKNDQIVISPRIIIEPIEDLKVNINLNYKKDVNFQERTVLAHQTIVPNGLVDRVSQAETVYAPTMITNEYFSPNIYATYDKSIEKNNFHATVGFTSEENNYYLLGATTDYLISNNIVSLNSSLDDDQIVSEAISHWSTVGVLGRLRYNYDEKYLLEFTYRRDGSSRFEPENRWAGFPSFSAGYNVAKEDFWPLEAVNRFKLRGSYGTLGNQNVANYSYLSTIPLVTTGTTYLFDDERLTYAQTPSLTSQSLTWEIVKTTDIGFDLGAFNNKLDIGFSWFRTDIQDMAAQGLDLPAQLGTTAPLTNIGTARTQGFDLEATWKDKIGDFGYSIKAVLMDYKRTMVDYPNETGALTAYYEGQDLGEIWGFETDGLFLTDEEATTTTTEVDYSFLTGWARVAGDLKYKDINGDGVVDRGNFTKGDSGDWKVIGNNTPRYQFSVNLAMNYKNWDFNALIQGVGKRDLAIASHQRFRGPANGPFHAFVWEGHLDYFRPEDTASPLGANTDAYFPTPYMNGGGRNNKNYQYNTTHFLQNGAYTRLKSLQIGYTLPKAFTNKFKMNKVRIYATGENLLTFTDLMFFDPEVNVSGLTGSAQSYPLSKIISTGVNISF